MRLAPALLLLLWLGGVPSYADEPGPEDRVFLEIQAPPDPAFVHQDLRVALRLGIDRDYFDASAIQLFRQPLDVPVQVTAPWLVELPGTESIAAPDPAGETQSLVLNGAMRQAEKIGEETRDGRVFTVYLVEARYVAPAPVTLELAAPSLRFAYATRFEEDFLGGRVAVDRRDVDVEGEARTLEIHSLPEDGRPEVFTDAVGRFAVSATADLANRTSEGAFPLRLVIEGEGNLAALTPPAGDRFEGFHVYGHIDELTAGGRVVTYEIAPLTPDVETVPAIPFAYFDPTPPAKYRVVETAAIPLRDKVLPPEPDPASAAENESTAEARRFPWGSIALGAVCGAVAVLLLGRRRSRRDAEPEDPHAERKAAAIAALREAVEHDAPDLVGPFSEFLAAHLGRPAAAAIAPDLPVRLVEAGVPVELAADAAAILERLVAARYGGDGDPAIRAGLRDLIDPLEAVLGS